MRCEVCEKPIVRWRYKQRVAGRGRIPGGVTVGQFSACCDEKCPKFEEARDRLKAPDSELDWKLLVWLVHGPALHPKLDEYTYRGFQIRWRNYLPATTILKRVGLWYAYYQDQASELLQTVAVLDCSVPPADLEMSDKYKRQALAAMFRLIDDWFEGKVAPPKFDYESYKEENQDVEND